MPSLPQVIPTCQQIFGYRGGANNPNPQQQQQDDNKSSSNNQLIKYFPGLNINWSSSDSTKNSDELNSYRWNVYIGDIITVSTTELSNVEELEEWEPTRTITIASNGGGGGAENKNSKKKTRKKDDDSHWKVGLVLALTQVTDYKAKRQTFECTVLWLYKANDRDDFKKHLKNQGSFRPDVIPHMLLNSKGDIESIPISKILPVQVTMLTQEEFKQLNNGKLDFDDENDEYEDDENRFINLRFFCSKVLTSNGQIVSDNNPSEWAQFNTNYQYVVRGGGGGGDGDEPIRRNDAPRPLKDAWKEWGPVTTITELAQNLYKGYKEASQKKLREMKEASLKKYNAEQAQKQKEEEEVEKKRKAAAATNTKKKKSKKSTRFMIEEEGIYFSKEGRSERQTMASSGKKTAKKILSSALKTTTTKLVTATKAKTTKTKAKVAKTKKPSKNASQKQKQEEQPGTPSTVETNSSESTVLQVIPLSRGVFTTSMKKKRVKYYDRIQMTIYTGVLSDDFIAASTTSKSRKKQRKLPNTLDIAVGDILAIQSGDDDESAKTLPFCVEWGIAQVLAIYKFDDDNDIDASSWRLHVRWFSNYDDLSSAEQKRIKKMKGTSAFDKRYEVIESLEETNDCPIEAALPAIVRFVQQQQPNPETTAASNGLPLIYFNCHYFNTGTKIEQIDDWQNYHEKMNFNSCALPDHLTRGLNLLPKSLAKRYQESIMIRRGSKKEGISTMKRKIPSASKVSNNNIQKGSTKGNSSKKKRRTTMQVTPSSNVIHSQKTSKKKGKSGIASGGRDYYQSVEIKVDNTLFEEIFKAKNKITSKRFVVCVGDIIAVQDYEDMMAPALLPFRVGWHVAQVISIYRTASSTSSCWELGIRRFFRYRDLDAEVQETVKSLGFSKENGLLECSGMLECSMDWVLPARIEISTMEENGPLQTNKFSIKDGLPFVSFQCSHLQTGKNPQDVLLISDWEENILGIREIVPGPLERGFKCLPFVVGKKYKKARVGGADEESMDLDSQEENDDAIELGVVPLSSKPICERWQRKFYDGIRVDIEQNCLNGIVPRTRQWTIKVGYVVPIQYGDASDGCYPYVTSWVPAQIVSIYKETSAGKWMMQIRWFNRYRDLLARQRQDLDSFDRTHVVFETELYNHISVSSALPGRVAMVSNPLDDWEIKTSLLTGLPIIPRLCSHICLDEDIDCAQDWTGYDLNLNSIPAPLTRGLLLSPKNRKNKDWALMLSRYYKKSIKMRGTDPDQEVFRDWSSQKGSLLLKQVEFDPSDVSTSIESGEETAMEENDSTKLELRSSMKIALPLKYVASPSKSLKRNKKSCFNFSLGDVVCYYDPNAITRADSVLVKNLSLPWHPFQVPWSYGQVLSIKKETVRETSDYAISLEVRRFLRVPELPVGVQDMLPTETDDREEVLECDLISDRISASRVLGNAAVYLANHSIASNNDTENGKLPAASSSCRCRFFFLSGFGRIQPIYCSSLSPRSWFDRLKERGFSLSKRTNPNIQAFTSDELKLDPCAMLIGSEDTAKMNVDPLSSSHEVDTLPHMYRAAEISPNWSDFVLSDRLFNVKDRQGQKWKVQVGDLVAVKDSSALQNSGNQYPFLRPWTPCQVLEIYCNKSEVQEECLTEECLSFKVGLLKFGPGSLNVDGLPLLTRNVETQETDVKAHDLLGPLFPCTRVAGGGCDFDWSRHQNYLPFAPVFVDDRVQQNRTPGRSRKNDHNKSRSIGQETKHTEDVEKHVAWTTVEPFHVDLSQHRLYYSEFNLRTQSRTESSASGNAHPHRWKLRMGDSVMIHSEGPKRYPMDCNWGVAEIVAIWKHASSADELEAELHSDDATAPKIYVEIRWFYERHEIVGFQHGASSDEDNEIFETDHLDILDAVASILGPVNISAAPALTESRSSTDSHASTLHSFFCRRFWSTTRKSLIPCGSQSGRRKRGWLHSKHLTVEMQRKIEMTNQPASLKQPQGRDGEAEWRHNFEQVINKMTLKEASKGAYERGETLVGREKELQQLLSFFRSAIRGGAAGSCGQKSSLFLAGPPGVGKVSAGRISLFPFLRSGAN